MQDEVSIHKEDSEIKNKNKNNNQTRINIGRRAKIGLNLTLADKTKRRINSLTIISKKEI